MEQNSTLTTEEIVVPESKPCIGCGNPDVLKGYPNALCASCRQYYIKYPIPLWVKAFGGGIAILVVVLLFNLPKTLMPEIYFEKGIAAAKQHKYATAQRYFTKAANAAPGFYQAQAELLIAAFYNEDKVVVSKMAKALSTRNFEDEELLAKVNKTMDYATTYFAADSLLALAAQHPDSTGGLTPPILQQYIAKYPADNYAKILLTSILYNAKEYVKADSVVKVVLQNDPVYQPALEMAVALNRMLNKTKDALNYCDRLLAINKENVYAIANQGRINLKMNNYKDGLVYARKATNTNDTDAYAKTTLILAYHFNKMIKERDELIKDANNIKQGEMPDRLQFVLDVINHKDSL